MGAAALVLAFLAFALFYPLGRVLVLGVGEGFGRALANPYYWERYLFSLEYGLGSALLTLALALPLAFLFRWRFPGRAGFLALSTLPFVLPTPVVALGFLALVGPRGLLGLDLYGTRAVLYWAALFYNLGLALRILLPVALALERPLEAARVLGAGPFRAFLRVELPLLLPALSSGTALALAALLGEFGASLVLWRPEWTTLALAIYERLGRPGEGPFREAVALALVLALLSAGLFYLLDRGRGRFG